MDIENLYKTWNAFGEKDPLWAICTDDSKKGNLWDAEEFFGIGRDTVQAVLDSVELRTDFTQKHKSLDFGCGVGRLTFPLGDLFSECLGVDISDSMIEKANMFKMKFGSENCNFMVNKDDHLRALTSNSYDFILSLIVLQHMEPRYFIGYIKEFIRLLDFGGVLVFQLPDQFESRAPYLDYREGLEPVMEIYGMSLPSVRDLIVGNGGRIIDVVEDGAAGPELKSYRYFVTK